MPPWERYQQPAQGAPAAPINSGRNPADIAREQAANNAAADNSRADQQFDYQVQRDARTDARADNPVPSGYRRTADGGLEPIPGGPEDPTNASGDDSAPALRLSRLRQLLEQADRVQELHRSNVRGGLPNPIAGRIPFVPGYQQFDSAGAGLSEQGLAAFRVPGVGAQSDTELRAFIDANRPMASDTDARIDEKLRNLRSRAQSEIEALGGTQAVSEPEVRNTPLAGTVAPPANDTPPPLGSGGNDQGGFFGGAGPNYTPDNPPPGEIFLGYAAGPSGEQVPQFGPDPKVAAQADKLEGVHGQHGLLDLAGQGTMLGLGDEAAGVGTAIYGALTGDFDIAGNYQLGNSAEDLMLDRARERTGGMGTAAELLGGGGAIRAAPGALMAAGRSAAARSGGLTREGMRGALTRQATTAGAGAGALGGFGYGEGFEGSTSNALVGALTGAALGNVVQRGGNALAARSANLSAPNAAQQTQQAADNLGVDLVPAMTGGAATRAVSAGAQQGFVSRAPVVGSIERMQGQAGAARTATADRVGRVVGADDAGEIVRQAGNAYSRRTGEIGSKLYDRAARMAGDAEVALPSAIQRTDEALAELAQAPGGADSALARDLTKLREQMAGGSFKPSGVRQMRTMLREQMQERGLRGSNSDRIFGDIAAAAEADMFTGLQQAGKESAAGAYRTASNFWRERVQTIDEVLEPVLGKNAPRSGEQILSALERLGRPDSGNAQRLRRLMQAMPKEEAASVRATVINRLGRPTKGVGEVVDENSFSLERFLTQWNDMTPRARSVMFPPESAKALSQLATLGAAAKRAGGSLNTSNTGGAIAVQGAISAAPLMFLEPFTVASITGAQYGVGRLLASPRFARWLAGAPSNPRAMQPYMARLGDIAKAEPFLARDIAAYSRAVNDNGTLIPQAVAGGEQAQDDRQPPAR